MASESQNYYKRVGHISIRGADGMMHDYCDGENALDFKFRIKKPLAAVRMEADISILGLSMDTIHTLTCWQPWNVMQAQERKIEVYAGYEDTGENLIFEGYIISAKPTQPPNMWLNIKADNLSYYDKKIVEASEKSIVKFKTLVQQCCSRLKINVDIDNDVEDRDIKGYCFYGRYSDFCSFIEHLNDVYAYMENPKLLRIVRRIPTNYPPRRGYMTLTKDTGLLGISQFEWDSLVAHMRLDTRFKLNDFIYVKSSLYPENASGAYLINTVEYNGHLRGQEWETVIHAWNYTRESNANRQQLNGNTKS